MRTAFVVAAVLLALASGPARAQGGFGLDLSSDPNAPQSNEQTEESSEEAPPDGSMGLDLSSGPGADLMPRFGLVGLDTPERAGAAAAKRWVGWLQGVAFRTGKVVRAATPAEVRQQLGNDYATTLRCAEASCLSGAADTLDADLLTTARLSLEDEGWTLRLWTFDRDRGVVETDVVTGRKPTDSTFIREAGETLAKRVTALARPRAMLKVTSNVSRAVVRVGSRVLGVGSVEAKLPPGDNQIVVEADDYNTYTKTVTLTPGETKELAVRLEFSGAAPESPLAELDERTPAKKRKSGSSNPTIFSRPALYTTVLGLAAVGAGVAMGLPLQQRTLKIDRQGVVDIHRGEYEAMRQSALISTALMAGGGAVAAGSLAWLIIVPQRSAPASSSVAPVAGGTGGSGRDGMALHLVFGGSF